MPEIVKEFEANLQDEYEITFAPAMEGQVPQRTREGDVRPPPNDRLPEQLHQYESLKKTIYYLQREKERLDQEIKTYQQEIGQVEYRQETIEKQKKLIRSLEDKQRDLQEKLAALEHEELPAAEERLKYARDEFKRAKMVTVETYKNIERARNECAAVEQEKEQMRADWHSQKAALVAELETMKEELEAFKDEHKDQYEKMAAFREAKQQLETEYKQREQDITAARLELADLRMNREKLVRDSDEQSKLNIRFRQELAETASKRQQTELALTKLREESEWLATVKNNDIAEQKRLRLENQDLLDRRDRAVRELCDLGRDLENTRGQLAELNRQREEQQKTAARQSVTARPAASRENKPAADVTYIISYNGKNYLLQTEELRQYLNISKAEQDEWVWNERDNLWEPIDAFRTRFTTAKTAAIRS